MDIAFPIASDNGRLKTETNLAQQRVYSKVVTIKGERPYRPGYGVRQTLFMNPFEYPRDVEEVLLQIDYDSALGNLTYTVEDG